MGFYKSSHNHSGFTSQKRHIKRKVSIKINEFIVFESTKSTEVKNLLIKVENLLIKVENFWIKVKNLSINVKNLSIQFIIN